MSSDPLILSYGDTSLYQSDLDILKQRYQWLNDAIIQFFFEYLSEDEFKQYLNRICFMSASTVFMLHFIEDATVDGLKSILGALKLETKDIIFIPINNNQDPNAIAGGSHWSLLVFIKQLNCYYYYDSIPNNSEGNADCAVIIAKTLSPLLLSPSLKWNKSSMFKIRQSPKQSNGYDCGLYLLSNVEYLSTQITSTQQLEKDDQRYTITPQIEEFLNNTITPQYITNKRQSILDLVNNLMKQKK